MWFLFVILSTIVDGKWLEQTWPERCEVTSRLVLSQATAASRQELSAGAAGSRE